ncbi:hypothetical protein [Pseudohalioglobus sediminis]|nr:hypothetical protein [Pseudohalioglobus sediminis]
MKFHRGAQVCANVWHDVLDNEISGQQGIMVSLQDSAGLAIDRLHKYKIA